MQVTVTHELSPELQKVADLRDHVRKMEAGVEYAKGELKTAKELLEAAQDELNTAIDELIEHEKQPTLFDHVGDALADEPRAARTVVSEPATPADPAGDDHTFDLIGSEAALPGSVEVRALPPATATGRPGCPTREQFSDDRTGKWEFLAAVFFHTHEDGIPDRLSKQAAEYARLKDQIADYRSLLDVTGKPLVPAWGNWSEFTVTLRNAAGVSVPCEVLYKPGWQGEAGHDHVEFWSPCISPSGHWSCAEHHPVKDGAAQYPAAWDLEERCRQLAQEATDGWAKEEKKAARKNAKKGA